MAVFIKNIASTTLRRTDEGDEQPITITTADGGMAVVERIADATAINVVSSTGLTFENIRITSEEGVRGEGVGIFGGSSHIGLKNIVIENSGGNGVHSTSSSDLQFDNVTITNAAVHGMRLSNIDGLVSNGLSIYGTGAYGIGIQKNTLSRDIYFNDTIIRNSGGDGVDVKGQMVHTGEPLIHFDGISVAMNASTGSSAGLDLRGHVSVNDANITLEGSTFGIRLRRGEGKDSDATGTNGSAGYGEISNTTITSLSGRGTGIQVSSGDTDILDTRIEGMSSGNAILLINATNIDDPIRLGGVSINGNAIRDFQTLSANRLADARPADEDQRYTLLFPDGIVDGTDGADVIDASFMDADGDSPGDGADTISAGAGDDTVIAGDGNDVIYGDATGAGVVDLTQTLNGQITVSTSSYWDRNRFSEEDLIDGITGTGFGHTRNGANEFFQLDFGQAINATQIVISNRANGYGDRLNGAEVVALGDSGNEVYRSAPISGAQTGSQHVFSLPVGIDARTFRLEHQGQYLHVAEFQVLGRPDAGPAGNDVIFGGAGDDTVDAGEGSDSVDAGAGDDTVIMSGSFNHRDGFDGGSGTDTLVLSPDDDRSLTVNISGGWVGDGRAGGQTFTNFENIITAGGNDNVIGDAGNNIIETGAGDDVLNGGEGSDKVYGGSGDDFVTMDGSFGGNDFMDGGSGHDTLLFSAADNRVLTINMAAGNVGDGRAGGQTFINFETVIGGNNSDTFLIGHHGASFTVKGGKGRDTFEGLGGKGYKYVDGGSGKDTLTFKGEAHQFDAARIVFTGDEAGRAIFDGRAGHFVQFRDVEVVEGTQASDYVDARADHNGAIVKGLGGNDELYGGTGVDELFGGSGNDVLGGGSGANVLTGGTGADRFLFAKAGDGLVDVITDFLSGTDVIDLSAHEIAFADLAIVETGGNSQITYGTGLEMVVEGVTGLTAGDFDFT